MRKFLITLLAMAIIALPFMPIAKATEVKVYVTNKTSTAGSTAVSTSTIIPGKHQILGLVVGPNTSGSGTITASLYDEDSTGDASSSNVFAELAGANTATHEQFFPYPKNLSTGLVIAQGAGTTVMVYYIDKVLE